MLTAGTRRDCYWANKPGRNLAVRESVLPAYNEKNERSISGIIWVLVPKNISRAKAQRRKKARIVRANVAHGPIL